MRESMSKLALAISITAKAFEKKLDKGGQPYILHCLRVMNAVNGDVSIKCVAVMHDLIEDTDEKSEINYTFELLKELGFSDKIIKTICLVTRQDGANYMDYIKSISLSDEATEIKLKDLEDNINVCRLSNLSKKDIDRVEKYHRAYFYLSNRKFMLSNWTDWNFHIKKLPIIIFGGDKASFNNDFDSRNKFVNLVDCYDFPQVFKIQSLDGKKEINRCFPFAYREATPQEISVILDDTKKHR